jgi:hypothetical protein
MRLVATKSFPYANRRMLPNDEFEASERDAKILVLLGNARYHVDVESVMQQVKVEAIDADEADEPPRKKRRYRRRDMKAEDE